LVKKAVVAVEAAHPKKGGESKLFRSRRGKIPLLGYERNGAGKSTEKRKLQGGL